MDLSGQSLSRKIKNNYSPKLVKEKWLKTTDPWTTHG